MDTEDLRLAVYRGLAADGRAAAVGDLAGRFRVDRAAVAEGLAALARDRQLVLDGDRIVMAHPATASRAY